MRLKQGDRVPPIQLPAIDNSQFDFSNLNKQRFLLCFFRFATCPFCNLRVHELTKRYAELGDHFSIVAIFDSPLAHLQKYASRHNAPFVILADAENTYYHQYGIENSMLGVLKGMFTRLPSLLNAMFVKGYVPLVMKGSITTMPADFLVDENGMIQTAYYGKDEGDHLPFAQVKAFATGK